LSTSPEAQPLSPVRAAGLFLGPILALTILSGHAAVQLDPDRPELNAVAGVAVWMAMWWLTEAVPIAATALLPMALFPLLSVMPAAAVSVQYGNHLLFLFLGGFMIALGVERSGLHRRVALAIVAAVGDSPRRVVLGFMLASAALSMWMSNTATTLVLLPIALSVVQRVGESANENSPSSGRSRNFGIALLLGIAYAASIGGLATFVGTPTNLAMRQIYERSFEAGPEMTFGGWFLMALPLSIVLLFVAWGVLVFFACPVKAGSLLGGADVLQAERKKLGPIAPAEFRMACIFVTTAMLWIFREPVAEWGWSPLLAKWGVLADTQNVNDTTVAMTMAVVCFVAPAARFLGPRLMDWQTAKRLPWEVFILFGGGLALADGMKQTGLDLFLGEWFGGRVADMAPELIATACTFGMTFLTELTGNLSCVQMSMPVLAGVAQTVGCDPRLLMVPATLASSCAFMLPVATPPNAIVYGSGRLTIADMAKAGIWLNLVSALLIVAFVLALGVPTMGIAVDRLPEWATASP